jgi:hypothetical protein
MIKASTAVVLVASLPWSGQLDGAIAATAPRSGLAGKIAWSHAQGKR